ncbi:histidine phosphatase family protein [Dysgonomonas sp. OttesenSCG-928-M03]|nr:histidine phosphatase family protein [Dysgonomonas sp. OttesenSCG-928-M03]
MSSKIIFYIARHGKTLLNTLDRVQGWCDSPLTAEGIEVAEYLGTGMRDIHFDAVYTSDLRRTRQTAETILKEKGQADLPIIEKFGFREACFGGYESDFNKKMWNDASLFLQYVNMEDMYKDVFNGKISNKDVLNVISKLDHMGLAETFEQVESRSQQALTEIAENENIDNKDKNILIVAHGMSIICMLFNLGGKDLLKSHLDNAAVCKVIYQNGHFTVQSMGDMSYVHNGRKIKNVSTE